MKWYSILIILLLFSSFSGCINQESQDTQENYSYILSYRIEVLTLNKCNNSLIMPIPLTKEKEPVLLLENLTILSGEANYSISKSEYGNSLIINYSDSFILNTYKKFSNEHNEKYLFYKMSLSADSTGTSYIFLDSTINNNSLLNFNCYEKYSGVGRGKSSESFHTYEWEIKNYTLMNGWQIVNTLKTWEIEG